MDLLAWAAPQEIPAAGMSATPVRKLYGRCLVCGRALSSPAAMEAGMGPVCAAKNGVKLSGAKGSETVSMHAEFTYQIAHGVLCIVDTGKGNSVTNDADWVIERLSALVDLGKVRGVIYRDTMGMWDEIIVRNGQFSTFRAIRADERDAAIIALSDPNRPMLNS